MPPVSMPAPSRRSADASTGPVPANTSLMMAASATRHTAPTAYGTQSSRPVRRSNGLSVTYDITMPTPRTTVAPSSHRRTHSLRVRGPTGTFSSAHTA